MHKVGEFMTPQLGIGTNDPGGVKHIGKVNILSLYNWGWFDFYRSRLAFQVGKRGKVCGHHFQEEGMRSCSETRLAEQGCGILGV